MWIVWINEWTHFEAMRRKDRCGLLLFSLCFVLFFQWGPRLFSNDCDLFLLHSSSLNVSFWSVARYACHCLIVSEWMLSGYLHNNLTLVYTFRQFYSPETKVTKGENSTGKILYFCWHPSVWNRSHLGEWKNCSLNLENFSFRTKATNFRLYFWCCLKCFISKQLWLVLTLYFVLSLLFSSTKVNAAEKKVMLAHLESTPIHAKWRPIGINGDRTIISCSFSHLKHFTFFSPISIIKGLKLFEQIITAFQWKHN